MTTHDQWIRKASLFVGKSYTVTTIEAGQSIVTTGSGYLDLSKMHFTFQITQSDFETPNNAYIRVFNLSEQTAKQIQNEFTRVVVQAGYENGAFGVIFDGTIKQIRKGRVSPTDTYLDILAADNDLGFNFGVVNKTIAAGATPEDQASVLSSAMGTDVGYTQYETGASLPRGKVMYGMARDHLRNLTKSTGTSWSVQNGKLQIIPMNGYVPGSVVTLTSKTGMIGLPEQTQDGIKVVCLLNPRIAIGSCVKIDNSSIQQMMFSLDYTAINLYPSITDDGQYRVLVVEYHGDTRGTEWYCELTCLAVNQTSGEVVAQ